MFFLERVFELFKNSEKTYKQFRDTAREKTLFCESLGVGRLVFNVANAEEEETNDERFFQLFS